MLGQLYIVATPIGNLADFSQRGIETLKKVDLILTEDTRVTKKLLIHYEIQTPILSYHQHSSDQKKFDILTQLVNGQDLALVADAGTPGISDPGNELIDFILKREPRIKIVPVPGPSALSAALSISGLKTNQFIFLGFLPKKKRNKLFKQVKELKMPLVFFESPYRIKKTLNDLIEHFGKDQEIFVGRELTKLHETVYRGSLEAVQKQIEKEKIKGELVVILSS